MYPSALRIDLDGAWMSNETDKAMADISCEIDPIPGEAHWQIGLAEGSIHFLVKDTLGRLARGYPTMLPDELL